MIEQNYHVLYAEIWPGLLRHLKAKNKIEKCSDR